MERKLLFFDIDGTLLPDLDNPVPESTKEAIAQAQELGHYTFINTGRTKCLIPEELLAMPFDGYLCGCGTHIILHDQVLIDKVFDRERGNALTLHARDRGIAVTLEGNDSCYYDSLCPAVQGHASMLTDIFHNFPDKIRDINLFPDYRYSKFCALADSREMLDDFLIPFADYFEPIDRGDRFFEIVPAGYSKASAIDVILSHLGQSLDDCYVFGDSSNDLPMLNHVTHSIAMGNSSPDVLAAASYVTTPVWREGIPLALKHFGLI